MLIGADHAAQTDSETLGLPQPTSDVS
jgi:hypothetical protein